MRITNRNAWHTLQQLKLRVLQHAADHGNSGPQADYWWQHYFKLNKLQCRLEEMSK